VAEIEGNIDQPRVKARFEEAKLRNLSSQDWTGRFNGSKSTPVRPDNHYYGQFNTASCKCFVWGGDNVISQLSEHLAYKGQECQATILVQKGAPLNLLLGTDVLAVLWWYHRMVER